MKGRLVIAVTTALLAAVIVAAQSPPAIDLGLFGRMTWRSLGPFRSGRATAVAASPTPGVFFEGVTGAGLWKTNDNGRTWEPVLEMPPGRIVSAVAVSASRPAVVYAGLSAADDATASPALYRSDDGGGTWTSSGLETTGSIQTIAIDSRDPLQIWIAVCCDAANESSHALLRSADGGRTFRPSSVGPSGVSGADVVLANGSTLYAAIHAPAGAAIVRSTNDGSDWTPLTRGWPASDPRTNRAFALAPSSANRLYATADVEGRLEVLRSDNGGDNWEAVGAVIPQPDVTAIRGLSVDPHDPDRVVLVAGHAWMSRDGARTWSGLPLGLFGNATGAIAHGVQPGVLAIGGTAGLAISVNNGATWSSPFTQPTADLTSVSTDGAFPFRVCGTQQGAAPVCVPSRIERDRLGLPQWQVLPLGADAHADPADPDMVYDAGGARFDRRTGQVVDVGPVDSPRGDEGVLAFSPDGRAMYLAAGTIRRSVNAGQAWTTIAPSPGSAHFSALAVSAIDARTIWAGTTDGGVRVSRDGGATWTAAPAAASAIRRIEPSHFDTQSAYVVPASGIPLLRTRDGGVSWQPIMHGLATAGRMYVVREDPFRRGLLLAGTDQAVFVSFDDGESWQPWRLDFPTVAVRDLALRDATLIAATAGRGFWALDDMSPLRQLTADVARADAFLFRPTPAYRLRAVPRADAAGDAPMPDPAPDGAVFSYLVGRNVRGPVTLEVIDTAADEVIRRFDLAADGPATAGLHQIVWDLRYAPPTAAPDDRGPLVVPGTYQVRLTVNGRALRQAVVVRMDPRLHVASADLAAQLALSRRLALQMSETDRARTAAAPDRRAALTRALEVLRRVAARVDSADARPSPSLEADAVAALTRAMAP